MGSLDRKALISVQENTLTIKDSPIVQNLKVGDMIKLLTIYLEK